MKAQDGTWDHLEGGGVVQADHNGAYALDAALAIICTMIPVSRQRGADGAETRGGGGGLWHPDLRRYSGPAMVHAAGSLHVEHADAEGAHVQPGRGDQVGQPGITGRTDPEGDMGRVHIGLPEGRVYVHPFPVDPELGP